jgi:hypothetical protein
MFRDKISMTEAMSLELVGEITIVDSSPESVLAYPKVGKKWKEAFFVLYEDSTIQWFDKPNDKKAEGSIRDSFKGVISSQRFVSKWKTSQVLFPSVPPKASIRLGESPTKA